MSRRDYIRMKTLLAAALGQLGNISHEHRKSMTEDQIISLFHRDHDPIPFHIGGTNEHWNLQWIFRGDHIQKTAKQDIPLLRKGDRITEANLEFRQRILAKSGQAEAPLAPRKKHKWGSRKMQSRPMRSPGR